MVDTFLFYEEFDKKKQKGELECGKLTENGWFLNQRLVFGKGRIWHLSVSFCTAEEHFLIQNREHAKSTAIVLQRTFPMSGQEAKSFSHLKDMNPNHF